MTQFARVAPEKQLVFAATGASFLSATLLFSIQPMFTKMVLPVLGGSPSTWSVAMVFFQGALLLGYAYAHLLTRYLPFKLGAIVHVLLLLTAFATLPISFNAGNAAPTGGHPGFWILSTFTLAIGLPFLALSTHGPLLQAWFALSRHERAQNPYFLYVASNIGSFAALLAYPFLIEPFIGLNWQSKLWSAGFLALIIFVIATLLCVRPSSDQKREVRTRAQSASLTTLLSWTGLAFIPSALLVSVTSHISTDIASAPLLWVAPLGLYLLSFPIAFRDKLILIKEQELHVLMIWGVIGMLVNMTIGSLPLPISLGVHLGLFLVITLACHHALYLNRPSAELLTNFYLCMSFGGVLGGLFSGLIAPSLFSEVIEYPLLLVASICCLPGAVRNLPKLDLKKEVVLPIAILALALAVALATSLIADERKLGEILICSVAGLAVLLRWRQTSYVVIATLAGFIVMTVHARITLPRESHRSFFGVTYVKERDDGFRLMVHGTTVHGAMRIRNKDGSAFTERPIPATYYTYQSPMGEAIASHRRDEEPLNHLALIGLGTGALACHLKPGESATFYEIDPLVVQLAKDRNKFRFLSDCSTSISTVLGDARLMLRDQQQKSDIVLIDAFSSDSIPVHLLTLEALDLYLSKLEEGGRIVFHISNNYFDLSDVLARAAKSRNLDALFKRDMGKPRGDDFHAGSLVAVLARGSADLDTLRSIKGWEPLRAAQRKHPWTDDYSTILEPLIDMWRRNRS